MVTLTKDPDICSLVDPYTDEMLTGLQDVDFGSGSREVWSEMLRERDFDCSDCGIIVGFGYDKTTISPAERPASSFDTSQSQP